MIKLQKISQFLLVLVTLMFISACGRNKAPESTRITIDLNPSFEVIIDEEENVVSITALNDDASVLLYGEVIVGMNIEDATNKVITLCAEMGYVTSSSLANVKISVSGDNRFKKNLQKSIAKEISNTLEDFDIKASVEKIDSLKLDLLKELVLENSILSQEEVDLMSEQELINALKVNRIETQELLNEEMRKYYFAMKNYEVNISKREFTSRVIEELGLVYQLIHSGYNVALDAYDDAIEYIEELKYDLLIDSDSLYQKTLNEVLKAKTQFLKQKTYVASLEDENLKVNAEIKLNELENVYNNLVTTLGNIAASAINQFDQLITAMETAEQYLISLEDNFDDNIEQTLSNKTSELDQYLNELKSQFFEKFELEYKDDILAYENMLKEQKEQLKK